MSLDAIKQITDAEETARQAKLAAEASARGLCAKAQQMGAHAVEEARSKAEATVRAWMTQAETQAAAEAKQEIAAAARTCDQLKTAAEARLDDAAAWIVRRVVNMACQS